MKSVFRFLVCCGLCLRLAAQEGPDAGAAQTPYQQMAGYWVFDFDSPVTKATLLQGGGAEDPNIEAAGKKDMEAGTFEITDAAVFLYQGDENAAQLKVTIKSQNAETQTVIADCTTEDTEVIAMTMILSGDRLTMNGKQENGSVESIGLKRITKEAFEKRVPEALRKQARQAPDEEQPENIQPVNPIEANNTYPFAAPYPEREGFVYSPYTNKPVDVRDIPTGTLVMDPTTTEKKMFRVP